MKWIVTNALSRDVERQQLNKILADIRATCEDLASKTGTSSSSVDMDALAQAVEGNVEEGINVTYDNVNKTLDFVVNNFTIQLAGDVTGSGEVSRLSDIIISTTLDPSKVGISDAPIDNQTYWRKNAEWEAVPDQIFSFLELQEEGFPALTQEDAGSGFEWLIREFEAEAGQLVITNPKGKAGNPKYGLDTVGDTGVGSNIVDSDIYGRVIGTSPAAYQFTQASAASTWTINHNLNRNVTVSVYTVGGVEMLAQVIKTSLNQVQVLLDAALAGFAVIH
jgi:hypothetical protein